MNRLQTKLEKIGRDAKVTAKAVGLKYISDRSRGYFRIKKENSFGFVDENGNKVKDKLLLQRFKKLVIPPAYENVWVSLSEVAHLQFTGIDTKGRLQYRYHPEWNAIRNQSKFYRLRSFAEALPAIRLQVAKDLNRKDLCYEKVIALVVSLIEKTNIRIGNEAYSKLYGSFGLTTLKDKHVKFNGNTVKFTFKGKKGVFHDISLQSKKLAGLVKKCQDIPGKELFQYYDHDGNHHSIGSADVNHYLKNITGEDFTAKDFRTWAGSVNALCALKEMGIFEKESDCKKNIIAAIDFVAKQLGNTRTVCKKYYIHPMVISAYENGKLHTYEIAEDETSDLNPEEKLLLVVLNTEI
jgi:DNA topoisomerase-1